MPENKNFLEAMSQGHSAAWDQRWDEAVEHYRLAVDLNPRSSQAITNLALAFFQLQKYPEAEICYKQAAKLTPDDPMPVERLANIYERTGKIKQAIDQSLSAADLFLKLKDVDKAIENWTRVTQLTPEHLRAHSRLAVVHERLGHIEQAVVEYIAVASLLQDVGQVNEAVQTIKKAVDLSPENPEALRALELVRANKTLPKPVRQRGATGPLRMAAVREMGAEIPDEVSAITREGPDPIAEARQSALTALASLLFEVSTDNMSSEDSTVSSGFRAFFSRSRGDELANISKHLGSAIDYQTRADDSAAAKELSKAIERGLDFPAAFFNLGLLYRNLGQTEKSHGFLQRSINHPDYSLAAHLLIAEQLRKRERFQDALVAYLEALKFADTAIVPPNRAEELAEQYESFTESATREEDSLVLDQLCDNIVKMLVRPSWRAHLSKARQQLPGSADGGGLMPLAEILIEAKDTRIVESMSRINELARGGHLRSAMEEAYSLLVVAPTYLPLHIHMGDLLLRQNNVKSAMEKFTVVAEAYAVRGEAKRATHLLQRVVEISPMDFTARTRLIQRLSDMGQVDQAIHEYIKLADVQYRLAQLDLSRSTYEKALRLAQQTNANTTWSIRILKQMADIDLQRLDWRQALRVYEQLRTITPDDDVTRTRLIELHVRLGQPNQAATELNNYMTYLSGKAKHKSALAFLQKFVAENDELAFAHTQLAELYQEMNRTADAIHQWDKVAELMVVEGNIERAKEVIRAILLLNPPNAEQYRAALQRLG